MATTYARPQHDAPTLTAATLTIGQHIMVGTFAYTVMGVAPWSPDGRGPAFWLEGTGREVYYAFVDDIAR